MTWALDITAPIEFAVLDLLWPRDLPSGGPWEARLVTGGTEAGSPPEGPLYTTSIARWRNHEKHLKGIEWPVYEP